MFACHKLDYTHNNEGDIEKNNYICEMIQRAEMLREEGGLTKGAPVRVDTEHIYYLTSTDTWYTNFKYGWGGINDGRYLSYQKITGTGSYAANGDVAVYVSVPLFTDTNGLNYSVRIFTDIRPI